MITGRPVECTPEKIKEICGYLERGCTITDACALSDIVRTTWYSWKERGEAGEQPFADFLGAADRARAKARLWHLDVIAAAPLDPKSYNPKPSQWFLSVSDRENFGPAVRQQVDQTTTHIDANRLLNDMQGEPVAE